MFKTKNSRTVKTWSRLHRIVAYEIFIIIISQKYEIIIITDIITLLCVWQVFFFLTRVYYGIFDQKMRIYIQARRLGSSRAVADACETLSRLFFASRPVYAHTREKNFLHSNSIFIYLSYF